MKFFNRKNYFHHDNQYIHYQEFPEVFWVISHFLDSLNVDLNLISSEELPPPYQVVEQTSNYLKLKFPYYVNGILIIRRL